MGSIGIETQKCPECGARKRGLGELMENLNPENRRKALFSCLDTVLTLSMEKFKREKKSDNQRLKWGRLIVNAISVYGRLLETEELEQRVEKLEEQIKNGVVIPGEEHKQKTKRY